MIVLTPIGLLAPGGAFGEDAPAAPRPREVPPVGGADRAEQVQQLLEPRRPRGLRFPQRRHPVIGYLLSAVVGIVVISVFIVGFIWIVAAPHRTTGARATTDPEGTEPGRSRARPDGMTDVLEAHAEHVPRRRGSSPASSRCARAAASASGRRAASSRRPSRVPSTSCAARCSATTVAQQRGLLQRIDPRVKIVSLLGLLIVTAFVRNIPALVAMYAATVLLAIVSRAADRLLRQAGVAVHPDLHRHHRDPGDVQLHHAGPHHPAAVASGTAIRSGSPSRASPAAGLLVMRVATSVSLVVLLTVTTPWTKLLAALRALFVPRIFILIIGMAYRYIFLLLNSVTDMYTARKARTVGNRSNDCKEGQRVRRGHGGRPVRQVARAVGGSAHGDGVPRVHRGREDVVGVRRPRDRRRVRRRLRGRRRARPGRGPAPWRLTRSIRTSRRGRSATPHRRRRSSRALRCSCARACRTPTSNASPPSTGSASRSARGRRSPCWAPTGAGSRRC